MYARACNLTDAVIILMSVVRLSVVDGYLSSQTGISGPHVRVPARSHSLRGLCLSSDARLHPTDTSGAETVI